MKCNFPVVRILLLVGLVLLCAACGGEPNPLLESGVVGFWESAASGPSAMGNSLELRADSSTAKFIATMVDYRYTCEGDQLLLKPIRPESTMALNPTSQVDTFTFSISGDTLLKATDNRKVWLKRVEAPAAGAQSLVGTWRAVWSTDAVAVHTYERYTDDGRMLMRLPVRANTGTYTIAGDSLVLLFKGERTRTLGFRVTGDTLQLQVANRPASNYFRVADTAWYPFE